MLNSFVDSVKSPINIPKNERKDEDAYWQKLQETHKNLEVEIGKRQKVPLHDTKKDGPTKFTMDN